MGILVSDCTNHSGLDGRFIRIGKKKRAANKRLIKAVGSAL